MKVNVLNETLYFPRDILLKLEVSTCNPIKVSCLYTHSFIHVTTSP
jgi:hypothetical protein